jgi:hypothetical protein
LVSERMCTTTPSSSAQVSQTLQGRPRPRSGPPPGPGERGRERLLRQQRRVRVAAVEVDDLGRDGRQAGQDPGRVNGPGWPVARLGAEGDLLPGHVPGGPGGRRGGGFVVRYRGLAQLGVPRASQLQLAQPLLTLAWSVLILGEHLPPAAPVAAVAVIACIVVTQHARPAGAGRNPVQVAVPASLDSPVTGGPTVGA